MKKLKQDLYLLAGLHAIVDMYGGFLSPILPGLCVRLGISPTGGGLLMMVYVMMMNLPQPFIGHIMEPHWRRTWFWFAPLVASVSCFIGFTDSYLLVLLILVVSALGMAWYHPEAVHKAHRLIAGRAHGSTSIMVLGGFTGNALGKVFSAGTVSTAQRVAEGARGEAVPDSFGFEYLALWILPGLYLSWLAWRRRERFGMEPVPKAPPLAPGERATPGEKRRFLLLFLSTASITTTILAFVTYLPFYFKSVMDDYLFFSGVVTFLFGSCGALGGLVLARLADRWGPARVLRWAGLPAVPCLLSLTRVDPVHTLWLVPIAGLATSAFFPVLVAAGQRFQRIGAGFSAGAMIGFTWGAAGAALPIAGRVVETRGPGYALAVFSFIPVLTFLFVQVLLWLRLPGEHK